MESSRSFRSQLGAPAFGKCCGSVATCSLVRFCDVTATSNCGHVPGYVQVNVGLSRPFDLNTGKPIAARFDAINLFDEKYEIRGGTGVGVGAPHFGRGRGFFVGLSQVF
jgi:outer membrane receptor protein involved in Fe transport